MREMLSRVQRALCAMALAAACLLLCALAACGLLLTAHLTTQGGMSEFVQIARDALLPNLVLTLAAIAALGLVSTALARFARVRLTGILAALWLIAAVAFLLGARTRQIYDPASVLEGARLFAQGNYKAMEIDYFNACSYQLGICLPMEVALRVLPGLDINLFMQAVNAFLSVASAGMLAALCEVLAGKRARHAAAALYLTCLPAAFYCAIVYSTLPMVFLCSCAFLCFALYLQRRRLALALACCACLAVAAMLKPNAAIPIAAIAVCAGVDFLASRDWKLMLCVLLGAALAGLLVRGVVWQYELRGGVTLTPDMSMLARLAMGLQRGGGQAGWYNRYIERFFPLEVTREQELAIAGADLRAQLSAFAADPASLGAFLRDKLLSQSLEATYGTLWYGNLSEQTGPLAQAARAVYAQGAPPRAAIERYMAIWQKAMYTLAAIGTAKTLCGRRWDAARLILPVTILGGFLYHMIFEAKSQYIYVYVLYMIPLAAQGLCALEAAAKAGLSRLRAGKP